MPHFYPFIYYQRLPTDRDLKMAEHVDVTAMMHVNDALYRQGYTLGEAQLNQPPADASPSERFGLASFEPGALIVSATRPDLEPDDAAPFDCKKTVQKGFTPLEELIEAAWRAVLLLCVRIQVKVHPFAIPYFTQGFASRRNIEFNARKGARYVGLPDEPSYRPGGAALTAAYLLRLRELWPGGPSYLGFFAMDSWTALVWSQLLRRRHSDLLQSEGFFMAELSGPLPARAPDLSWAFDWQSRIILRAPTAPPAPAPDFSLDRNSPARVNV